MLGVRLFVRQYRMEYTHTLGPIGKTSHLMDANWHLQAAIASLEHHPSVSHQPFDDRAKLMIIATHLFVVITKVNN